MRVICVGQRLGVHTLSWYRAMVVSRVYYASDGRKILALFRQWTRRLPDRGGPGVDK